MGNVTGKGEGVALRPLLQPGGDEASARCAPVQGFESLNPITAVLSPMRVHPLASPYSPASIAHLYHAPPLPPSCCSPTKASPPSPGLLQAALPRLCSAQGNQPKQFNPAPAFKSSLNGRAVVETSRCSAASRRRSSLPPLRHTHLFLPAHVCLPLSSPPLLARRSDLPLPSISPRPLGSRPPRSCCLSAGFKAELCSRLRFAGRPRECWSPGKAGGSGDGTLEMNNAAPISCRHRVNIAFPGKASSSLLLQGLPTKV